MPPIASNQAFAVLTSIVAAIYKEKVFVPSFFSSFFPAVETGTRLVDILVKRAGRKIAVDVLRGTPGNRNKMSRTTQKTISPACYAEFFDLTQLDGYDHLLENPDITSSMLSKMAEKVAEGLEELQKEILRACELQCAQALTDGIVMLENGDNIDYRRKAASVQGYNAGWDFSVGTVDPYAVIQEGCEFIRVEGKSEGKVFDAILGGNAWSAFTNNTIVKARADIRNYHMDDINTPQANAVGGSFHGEVTCGSYRVRLWTYNGSYDHPNGGADTPYMDPDKIIVLPENPEFMMAYGLVPQLPKGEGLNKSAFIIDYKEDDWEVVQNNRIRSCPVAVPVAIDKIWTRKVLN